MRPYFVEWVNINDTNTKGQWIDLDHILCIHTSVIVHSGDPRVLVDMVFRDEPVYVFLADSPLCMVEEELKQKVHKNLENFIEAWRDNSE